MKNLWLIPVIGVLLLACQKESETPKPDHQVRPAKKYLVTLKADGFSRSYKGFARLATATGDSLKNYITQLHYLVYDSQGQEISRYLQVSDGGTFYYPEGGGSDGMAAVYLWKRTLGAITDTLEAGNYTVVMLGVKDVVEINGPTHSQGNQLASSAYRKLTFG